MRKIIRYQPLCELSASYQTGDNQLGTTAVQWLNNAHTQTQLRNRKMHQRTDGHQLRIFFEGTESPVNNPNKVIPIVVDLDEPICFYLKLEQEAGIGDLKLHSNANEQERIGFPVLFDALIQGDNPQVNLRNNVKVVPTKFPLSVAVSATGIMSQNSTWIIKNEEDEVVEMNVTAKRIQEGSTENFESLFDFHLMPQGIYTLQLGNYSEQMFVTSLPPPECSVVLRMKSKTLKYPENIANPAFPKFALILPKN